MYLKEHNFHDDPNIVGKYCYNVDGTFTVFPGWVENDIE